MNELLQPTKIIRTKRRTLSLIINNDGDLIVRAPLNCLDSVIFDFINQKSNWIIKKRQQAANSKFKALKFLDNEEIVLLGNKYFIELVDKKTVKTSGNIIFVPNTNSKHYAVLYLKRELKKIITQKIKLINLHYNFNYKSISISSAKTNWGSCSADNRLHFTYKLMLCPERVLDYIIIHELVHTTVKNHSKTFWRNVKKIYPYYKECENWLKENRGIINII